MELAIFTIVIGAVVYAILRLAGRPLDASPTERDEQARGGREDTTGPEDEGQGGLKR